MKGRPRVSDSATLSLCLITKDEAKFIEDCIKSVADLVSQVVVVDTGSSDGTPELARALGAEVYEFEWNDSYADARNASLEHATGDWVLMLDADGELDEASKPLIRELLSADDRSVTYVGKARSYLSNGEVSDTMFRMLWPNRRGFRFVGRVHEQLLDAKATDKYATVATELVMHHYGYLSDVWDGKNKGDLYRRLIELELETRPDDFMTRFHAASHYLTLKEFETSLDHYTWCVDQIEAGRVHDSLITEWHALALGNMCGAYVQLGQFALATETGERAVVANDGVSLAWYWLGMARARTGDLDGGVEAMERARALGDMPAQTTLVTNQSMSGWLAEQALGEMHYLNGDYETAIEHLVRVADLNPTASEGWLLSAMALAAIDDFDQAVERFTVGVSLAEPGERASQAFATVQRVASRLEPLEVVTRSLCQTWEESVLARQWLLQVLEARMTLAEASTQPAEALPTATHEALRGLVTAWPALQEARELLDRSDAATFATGASAQGSG